MQQSQCSGETLNGQFFQMIGSDTRATGRFVDVVREGFSVSQSIGYVSYLDFTTVGHSHSHGEKTTQR